MAHRHAGHGIDLLARVAQECVRRCRPRLEWSVLDWNEPAIGLYRSLGARPLDDWTTQRLTGDHLAALAARATPA